MIKLKPYYERDDGDQTLSDYLKMVSDVVPFFREDVLDGVPAGTLGKPRPRTKAYQALLADRRPGLRDGTDEDGRKRVDAQLAEQLIEEYSKGLHKYLYEGCSGDGHVNREKLRELLTLRLDGDGIPGQIPKPMVFPDRGDGSLLLAHVFRYNAFSQHPALYEFVKRIGAEVCPYCNRLFTTTVTAKKHRTRPQLDHFKNKHAYSYLALSINNLVPSCSVCNLLKHDDDAKLVYPYGEGIGETYSFKTTIKDQRITEVLMGTRIAPNMFELDITSNLPDSEDPKAKRIQASIDQFSLRPLYDSHKQYVADMYFQRYVLTDEMIKDLWNQFGNKLFDSEEEIRAALLATYIQQERWGERPLSKLTHDIYKEIEKLYAEIHP